MNLNFLIKALSLPGGGAERVLADLTLELVGRGHDLSIVSFDPPNATDFYVFDSRVRRIRLGAGDVSTRTTPFDTLRRVAAVRRAVLKINPDVTIGFMHSAYAMLPVALVGTKIARVASEHTVYGHFRLRLIDDLVLRTSSSLFDRITVISDRVRAEFPRHIAQRMNVVPNPVTLATGRRADPAGKGTKTLLTVGSIRREKDHRTLIDAFKIVSAKHHDWVLRIVGDGDLRGDIEDQIRRLGLEDRIETPGAIVNISAEYASAQLFVLPSRYESFGLATAEALAHGLPAVGFADCPGTNELIDHGVNGLLANGPDRTKALASALDQMMCSESLRVSYGAAGPASVGRFSIDLVATQWESLLRSAIRHRRGSVECAE